MLVKVNNQTFKAYEVEPLMRTSNGYVKCDEKHLKHWELRNLDGSPLRHVSKELKHNTLVEYDDPSGVVYLVYGIKVDASFLS